MVDNSARNNPEIWPVPISLIIPSALNPRKRFDQAAIGELAESIQQHGLLQPIVVRPVSDDKKIVYHIVAGERRYRACLQLGLLDVPAIVREMDDREHLQLALIENLQRQDLDAIEEARGYAELNRVCGLKQAEIAAAVNRSQPAIANRMRLLKLPEEVQLLISNGELSPAHGVALARFDGFPAVQAKIATVANQNNWPSKSLENHVPARHELYNAGLTKEFHWQLEDLQKECAAGCPHNAYRKGDYVGICLKPSCFEEKVKGVNDNKDSQRQAKLEEVLANKGNDPVSIKNLQGDQYERLHEDDTPAACREDCPNRVLALNHAGNGSFYICIDLKCLRKLKTAETKAKNKTKKTTLEELTDRIDQAIDAIDTIGPAEIAFLCTVVMQHERSQNCVSLFKQHGVNLTLRERYATPDLHTAELDGIYTQPELNVVKATIKTVLIKQIEARRADAYYAESDQRIEWFLRQKEEPMAGALDRLVTSLSDPDNEPALPGFEHLVYPPPVAVTAYSNPEED